MADWEANSTLPVNSSQLFSFTPLAISSVFFDTTFSAVGLSLTIRQLWQLLHAETIDILQLNLCVFYILNSIGLFLDLIITIVLPQSVLHTRVAFLGFLLTCRPLILCCICIERYVAVVYPTRYQQFKAKKFREFGCVAVWAITVALPTKSYEIPTEDRTNRLDSAGSAEQTAGQLGVTESSVTMADWEANSTLPVNSSQLFSFTPLAISSVFFDTTFSAVGLSLTIRQLWQLLHAETIDILQLNLCVFYILNSIGLFLDLIITIVLPQSVLHTRVAFLGFLLTCGPLILCCICIERYVAVVYPTRYQQFKAKKFREFGCVAVWAITVALPIVHPFFRLFLLQHLRSSKNCVGK
ncbi:hypothetical protein AOLI_G00321370 [Acnodon oligacanthus]